MRDEVIEIIYYASIEAFAAQREIKEIASR